MTHKCNVCGRSGIKLFRPYGEFFREENTRCTQHKPESWYVPLVEDEQDGSVWGYTSVPDKDIKKWESLPE